MNISFTNKIGLCSGCGACTVICPHDALKMRRTSGINHPQISKTKCVDCQICLTVCPGYDNYLNNKDLNGDNRLSDSSFPKALIVHANDITIRTESSSGGYVTALLIALLENKMISGVITLEPDANDSFEYFGGLIQSVEKLKLTQGSIYHPVSVCEGINEIIDLEGQFAFVGKPCEVHAARLLSNKMKAIRDKIPLFISIFCHHTPTRAKNKDIIKSLKLSPNSIDMIKYRGHGWPGKYQVLGKNGECLFSSPYREIWDKYLSTNIPFPCQLCYDPYGEYADINVGDAWGFNDPTQLGISAVFLRTKEGEKFHNIVQQLGYLTCSKTTPQHVFLGQPSLQSKKDNESIVRAAYRLHCDSNTLEILQFLLKGRNNLRIKIKIMPLLLGLHRVK